MSNVTIPYRFVVRRGLAADWTSQNPVLLSGEFGKETDTGKLKQGDGSTAWNSLSYIGIWTLADIRRALDLLGSTAEGDIIYKGASGWTRLAKGTDGQVLTLAGGLPSWAAASGGSGSGAMTLVGAATVAGSAATSLTLSGLDLATDGRYVVYGNFANATGSAATISLFYNGDTTTTNYYLQFWQADGATNTPARNNSAALFTMNASSHLTMKADLLRDLAGYPRMTMQVNRHAPSDIALVQNAHIRNNTANVTSLTFSSSVAGALAVGSSFRVYKVS